jgi:hypothetical protein
VDDNDALGAQAGRLHEVSELLRQAGAHGDPAALHAADGDVPRMAAHVLALEGELAAARQLLAAVAQVHAAHAR